MPCCEMNLTAVERRWNAPEDSWTKQRGIVWSPDTRRLSPRSSLPDPDDRHVLAAAITARCDVIVTSNLLDFPDAAVTPYGIEVQHPDDFLSSHLDLMPGLFCEAVRKIRARLVAPPVSVQDYLAALAGQRLVAIAAGLAAFSALL